MAIKVTETQRTIQEIIRATRKLSFPTLYHIVQNHFRVDKKKNMLSAVGDSRVFNRTHPLTLYYNYRSQEIVSTFTHGECYLPVTYFSDPLQPPRVKRALDDIYFYLTHRPHDDGVYRQGLATLADVIQDTLTKRFEQAFINYETLLLTYPTFEEVAQRFANTPLIKPENASFKKGENYPVNVDVADFKSLEVGEFYFKYGQQIMIQRRFRNVRPNIINCLKEYIQYVTENPDGLRYQQVEGVFNALYDVGKLQSHPQLQSLYRLFIDHSLKTASKKDVRMLSSIKRRIKYDIYSP